LRPAAEGPLKKLKIPFSLPLRATGEVSAEMGTLPQIPVFGCATRADQPQPGRKAWSERQRHEDCT